MAYPYPDLQPLLQFRCTAKEYQGIIRKYVNSSGYVRPFNVGEDYQQLPPWYVRSVCPFCHKTIQSPLDTYSLAGGDEYEKFLYGEAKNFPGYADNCPHFMAVRHFLNLHGNLLKEVSYSSRENGEVPFIEDWCLPDDIASYAVLHALPICRVETDHFVPTYTLFTLIYFSQDPRRLITRYLDVLWELGGDDPDYRPAVFRRTSSDPQHDHFYDLQLWAALGLLGYLDFTQPDLPLRIGVDTELPAIYRHISGRRYALRWSRGQMTYTDERYCEIAEKDLRPW